MAFTRDCKRQAKAPHRGLAATDLRWIIITLANDMPLGGKLRDHLLTNKTGKITGTVTWNRIEC